MTREAISFRFRGDSTISHRNHFVFVSFRVSLHPSIFSRFFTHCLQLRPPQRLLLEEKLSAARLTDEVSAGTCKKTADNQVLQQTPHPSWLRHATFPSRGRLKNAPHQWLLLEEKLSAARLTDEVSAGTCKKTADNQVLQQTPHPSWLRHATFPSRGRLKNAPHQWLLLEEKLSAARLTDEVSAGTPAQEAREI